MLPVPGRDPDATRRRLLEINLEISRRKLREASQTSLIAYIKRIWPWFIIEEVHLLMAGYIEALLQNEIDRLMVFMPPRTGKSLCASVITPSWYAGRFPNRKIMQASYASELAVDFGRQVRDLVMDDVFQSIFPGVMLRADNKAAGRWRLSHGGEYFATGTTGGVAGRGYNLGVIDDPLSEQDAFSDPAKERVAKWYGPGFYTRRQPDFSAIMIMTTRWHKADLAGHLLKLKKEEPEADEWTVLKVPAILDAQTADDLNQLADNPVLITPQHPKAFRFKEGDSFAPRRWPKHQLMRQRANMTALDWEALYQQNPVEEGGNIFMRKWWRKWPKSDPPKCEYVVQVYDSAFEEHKEADYTARTTWGIFPSEERQSIEGIKLPTYCCILLERLNMRISFPDLRKEALLSYNVYKPDRVLIEKAASGHSLLQELKRKGVPVKGVTTDRSKLARAHAASVVLEQGCVFYMNRQWANEVIDQCADFPNAEHDDLVDTCSIAWVYLRRMFHLQLPEEEERDEAEEKLVDLSPRRLYG